MNRDFSGLPGFSGLTDNTAHARPRIGPMILAGADIIVQVAIAVTKSGQAAITLALVEGEQVEALTGFIEAVKFFLNDEQVLCEHLRIVTDPLLQVFPLPKA